MEKKFDLFNPSTWNFGRKKQSVKKQPARKQAFSGEASVMYRHSFDGEKNLGGIGPIRDYVPDHEILRLRSWQAFLDSDIAQTVVKRFCTWVIGGGLNLQSEPPPVIFAEEGINLDVQKFTRSVEARFKLFRQAKWADYSGMETLDAIANTAFKNAIVGGDVLVILRYENGLVNLQMIDGAHVQSPGYMSDNYPQTLENGNTICNGIERDKKGKHVRYWVRNKDYQFNKVEANSKESGLQIAFLVYGLKYRLNTVRGLPLISAVLESIKKMERYKDATLGSAEERAKIAYTIKHGTNSAGDSPLLEALSKAVDPDGNQADLPTDINGKQLADTIAATTEKQVFNMTPDSELMMHESKTELHFKDFFTVNVMHLCAAVEIPMQVAMSMYEGNFSASRAALKDWEHTLKVVRKSFADQFYSPVFRFWLDINILKGKIAAPGYLMARNEKDIELLEAYRTCRFIGPSVPHIDPLKEVLAERKKLGTLGDHLPITTLEASTEALSESDSISNISQFSRELEEASALGLEAVVVNVPVDKGDEDYDEDEKEEKKKEKKNDQ